MTLRRWMAQPRRLALLANVPRRTLHLASALGALLVLWVVVSWMTRWIGGAAAVPPAIDIPRVDEATAAIVSRNLFGKATSATAGAAPSLIAYRLHGVAAAATDAQSFALIGIEGQSAQAYLIGSELAPGIRLTRILPDRVELATPEGTRAVELPRKPVPADAIRPAGAGQGAAGSVPKPHSRGNDPGVSGFPRNS